MVKQSTTRVLERKPGKTQKPKTPKAKRPVGRPSLYCAEIAEAICIQLAQGKSLRSICEQEGMPDKSNVFVWLYKHPEFQDQYARAKAACMHAYEEDSVEIADDGTNDWMEKFGKDGESLGYQLNGEHVQRSKLRIDTRKWFMERLAPKRYGAKVDVNHGGQADNPLTVLMEQVVGTKFPIKGNKPE